MNDSDFLTKNGYNHKISYLNGHSNQGVDKIVPKFWYKIENKIFGRRVNWEFFFFFWQK